MYIGIGIFNEYIYICNDYFKTVYKPVCMHYVYVYIVKCLVFVNKDYYIIYTILNYTALASTNK